MLKLAVFGAAGRMGRAVLQCAAEADDLAVTGAVTQPGDPLIGRDAGEVAGLATLNVPLTDDARHGLHGAQVAIDFTLPSATEGNARAAVESGTALVVGTTGLEPRQLAALETAAREIPVIYARNLSVGVNIFMELVGRAAQALADFDVEIVEAHHGQKVDAPSGTALALGERVAGARGRKLADVAVHARHGRTGPRVPSTIGFAVVRGGNVAGDHSVLFLGPEEQIELKHHARDRKMFARGALRAARWLAGRAPGLYSMSDVLGFTRG